MQVQFATQFAASTTQLNSTSLASIPLTNNTQSSTSLHQLTSVSLGNQSSRLRRMAIVLPTSSGSNNGTYYVLNSSSIASGTPALASLDPSSRINTDLYWQMPASLVLISIKWWENFVGEDRGCLKLFQVTFAEYSLSVLNNLFCILEVR